MKISIRPLSLLILMALVLGACNLPSGEQPAQDEASLTAAAQTVQALLPSTTPTGFVNVPPTFTLIPGLQPTATTVPATLPPPITATSNCNLMQFVADITIPDGTIMTPNLTFTKTWRLKNNGTCTWTTSYAIVFSGGNAMNGPATQNLAGSVNPGQTIDVSVNLTAPSSTGDYKGEWKLRDASGVLFGYFYVQIKVQNAPTATNTLPPAVAQVVLNAIGGESGTVYEPAAAQAVASSILAGDTSTNYLSRGYMSFDISTLSGKIISSAALNLGSCSQTQNPFTSLAGIWVGELQYSLPLDQTDYDVAGTGIQLLNSIPAGTIDVKSYVQARVTDGKARFQIRLHPAGPSDADGQADYISCNAGTVTLTIAYQP
jgi:hypothetical protein